VADREGIVAGLGSSVVALFRGDLEITGGVCREAFFVDMLAGRVLEGILADAKGAVAAEFGLRCVTAGC